MSIRLRDMKLFITVLFLLSSAAVGAEDADLEVDFTSLSHTSNYVLLNGNTTWCPGWSFTTCYSAPASDGTLLVGKTDEPGQFTTQTLPLNGNASVIFEVKKSESGSAAIEASITGGGSLLTVAPTTINSDCHIACYVKDGTPSTRLTITGTAGKFYVKNMRVYNIGDAVFYESFDHMSGMENYRFKYINKARSELCDNSYGTFLTEVYQAYENIHILYKSANNVHQASSYVMPAISVADNSDALLTFNVSIYGNASNGEFSLSCSDDTKIASLGVLGLESNPLTDPQKWILRGESSNWHDCKIGLKGISSSTVMTIKGYYVNLDEVLVRPACILDEKENNDNKVSALSTVLLIRTLTPNIWCPLCLPFDVTQSQMEVATGTTCELRTLSDVIDGVFMFNKTTSVSAGTPFLVKVNTEVENPVFTGVTIVDTSADIATGSTAGYSFVGTYSPVSLNTDGTHLFLDKEGNLCQPGTEAGYNRLNGLRAYFVVPEPSEARVFISDTSAEVSRISNTSTARHNTYDLYGRQIDASYSKGLHIRNGRKYLIP